MLYEPDSYRSDDKDYKPEEYSELKFEFQKDLDKLYGKEAKKIDLNDEVKNQTALDNILTEIGTNLQDRQNGESREIFYITSSDDDIAAELGIKTTLDDQEQRLIQDSYPLAQSFFDEIVEGKLPTFEEIAATRILVNLYLENAKSALDELLTVEKDLSDVSDVGYGLSQKFHIQFHLSRIGIEITEKIERGIRAQAYIYQAYLHNSQN